MLKSHEKFHSANGKRQILIADDEAINREVLGLVLGGDYELLYASNGVETLEMIRSHCATLSLVLLDLMMPGMNGLEVLRIKRAEPAIQQIPVIVVTADQKAEVESLDLGAIDFIPKPYPQADVILARARRTIELIEDRQIILSTERDVLTGLYSREYFYRYAEQFDQHHADWDMDAIVLNINHFRMINERFGTPYGDQVLRRVGERLRDMVRESGGIVCRREADTFMVYCPHGRDYEAMLEHVSEGLDGENSVNGRVRLRMGVYEHVDKALPVERRFDRAKSAADAVRGDFRSAIGFYDDTLHEKELFNEQLIEDFHTAINERQFEVWYQPKFDIRAETPVLASAEGLVRWRHPKLGLVNPGVFIPLFEANGLIGALDRYVWREAASQIRAWKNTLGFSVPVSVNVSRIDILDPNLVAGFTGLLETYSLQPQDLLLEVTESAYTQDSARIIETVNRLRARGFQVEMDDFGTGYSSLSMISSMPIDALKLDMTFVRSAFDHRRDTRMLEVIIEIADYLAVPVIAEGVETEEQLNALKAMGCDIVQGYYFSKPVPAKEYERFLIARRDQAGQLPLPALASRQGRERDASYALNFSKVAHALSSGFESIYYVDLNNDHYVEFSSQGMYEDLKIESSGADFFADTRRNIDRVVFEADRERLKAAMVKGTLLSRIPGLEPFSILYRLVIGGKPLYYSCKAVRAGGYDRSHMIVGVRNVNDEVVSARRMGETDDFTPDFTGIAKAISRDIERIYYVDIADESYLEYGSDGAYSLLEIETSGRNFFAECQRNIQRAVYSADWEKVANAMDKQTLLDTLKARRSFSMDYRLMIQGKPVYYRMKVMPAETGELRHIIVGVSNVDAQISEEQRQAAERQNLQSFSRIFQALAQDYFIIYYIDVETDYFIEFSATGKFLDYGIEKRGENFFTLSRRNMARFTYSEDLPVFREIFTKENILRELDTTGSFAHTYRMVIDGVPRYVKMKVMRLDKRHIVLGTSDIDAQVRREQAQAQALQRVTELASRDALTGVKSKRVFVDAELTWDVKIEDGTAEPFAVAVFDLNGLKAVNDSQGHAAGDDYIRDACKFICLTFQHSPVYRIGGDEFAAILSGSDYARREELKEGFRTENANRHFPEKPVVACGMSDYRPGADSRFQDVFERADQDMYENKKELKCVR